MSREWTFRSEVIAPDGLKVVTAVVVPTDIAGTDVTEVGELTEMASKQLHKRLRQAEQSNNSRVFSKEVPF